MNPMQAKVKTPRCLWPIIVIRGLPGVGKTTLSNAVREEIFELTYSPPFQVNADQVRSSICDDLGFSLLDRLENAERIGKIAWLVQQQGMTPIVDFVMPTVHTFAAFASGVKGAKFLIYSLSREPYFSSRFKDTNALFEPLSSWMQGDLKASPMSCVRFEELQPIHPDHIQSIAKKIAEDALVHVLKLTRV